MNVSENESTSQQGEEEENVAPIVASFKNDKILPLFDDFVDRLQQSFNIIEQGNMLLIPAIVPTIVLVGDRCSGKSSLISSLIGIKIPLEGQFCTRVPVLIKLQNHQCPNLQFSLKYDGTTREVRSSTTNDHDDQWSVAFKITRATYAIAGLGNKISNKLLTIILKKNGFPNLTIVDLPGITHETCSDQKIREMIREYITPMDRIILNVLEARLDPLPNLESINMSKKVDMRGDRTLVVVTKAENVPYQGLLNALLLDKVTAMGLIMYVSGITLILSLLKNPRLQM